MLANKKVLVFHSDGEFSSQLALNISTLCDHLDLLKICMTREEAFKEAGKNRPDILILDTEVDEKESFALIESLLDAGLNNFGVIFTAPLSPKYSNFFRRSEQKVMLNPCSDEQMLKALFEQIPHKMSNKGGAEACRLLKDLLSGESREEIALPGREQVKLVKYSDIIRIEKQSNFSLFHFSDHEKFVAHKRLSDYENQLLDLDYHRVNDTNLINLKCFKSFAQEGTKVLLTNGDELELSPEKKDFLYKRVKELGIVTI